jgi:hypothetical protein
MAEIVKNISFSVAVFLIGAIFIFLGLSGGFTTSSFSFIIQDIWLKVISSLIGIVFTSFAIYAEIKSKFIAAGSTTAKSDGEGTSRVDTKQSRIQAQDFFYTLDDVQAENFPTLIRESTCVYILARTVVNLLSQYEKAFEQLGLQGCEIKLLFVDPSSEASRLLYGSNPEVYRNNITLAAQHLKRLKQVTGPRLQVRVMKHAPTLSIIVIGKKDPAQSFIHAQLYFLHSAVGRDRPIFRVQYCDKWYGIFQDEFSQLWSNGVEWDAARFLDASPSNAEV